MGRVGLLYVGQSPDPKYVSFFREALPADTETLEAGALDDLTLDEIRAIPRRGDEPIIVTKTRDLVPVTAPEAVIHSRLAQKLEDLENRGSEIVILVCTGSFSGLRSKRLLLKPSEILLQSAAAVARGYRLAVLTPLEEQVKQCKQKWKAVGLDPIVKAASPFGHMHQLERAAEALVAHDPALVVLDCMGYTEDMKRAVQRITGKPAIAARTMVKRMTAELFQA